ncbi:MAG: carboxypeptidase-like regulatory domain-containing protein, partial [Gammaproteobacteria bacterium]|nr:carboxypeptidase-like regulatory domain-containing protein [Gammaproteobacteria bacterium]
MTMRTIAAMALLAATCLFGAAAAELRLGGIVVDLNGRPVAGAGVVLDAKRRRGADYVTVFSGGDGRFSFPAALTYFDAGHSTITARRIGFRQVGSSASADGDDVEVTLVVGTTRNLADAAPASAWLARMSDRAEKSAFVLNCVGCHQVPSAEVRDYAGLIADSGGEGQSEVRRQSWLSITRYMNYLSDWEFGRAKSGGPPEAQHAYSVGPGDAVSTTMTTHFADAMTDLAAYDYGAPLAVTPDTVIREYEVGGV